MKREQAKLLGERLRKNPNYMEFIKNEKLCINAEWYTELVKRYGKDGAIIIGRFYNVDK